MNQHPLHAGCSDPRFFFRRVRAYLLSAFPSGRAVFLRDARRRDAGDDVSSSASTAAPFAEKCYMELLLFPRCAFSCWRFFLLWGWGGSLFEKPAELVPAAQPFSGRASQSRLARSGSALARSFAAKRPLHFGYFHPDECRSEAGSSLIMHS